MRPALPLPLLVPAAVWILVSGCGGSTALLEVPSEPPTAAMSGPAFRTILLEDGMVVARDWSDGDVTPVTSLSGAIQSRFPSPAGPAQVVVVAARDSSRLAVMDPGGGTVTVVETRPDPVRFTVAWAPDGSSFAYGYYVPTRRDSRPAMGDGDILIWSSSDRSAVRVGCSASRAVLAWLADGRLLVRNTDNLYVVDRQDCTTRATVDARRMHQLTASPDGGHVVYVHRELEYDRETRQYVADSTFMVAGPDGSEARAVVNFRYRPTRFAWRPDGSELAYDVENPDRPGQRLISIFDVASGSSVYLHPPTADGPSELDASWAPDGSGILYRQSRGSSSVLAVRIFTDPYAVVLEGSEGADPLGWAGADAVVARLDSGVLRVYPLDGTDAFDLPARADLLGIVAHGR